jgi:hypothetical protein
LTETEIVAATESDEATTSKLVRQLAACEGKTLEVDFERAALVAQLADVFGIERNWTSYIGKTGLMSARHAYNLRQVHARFAANKQRWIGCNASLTALTVLLPASDDLVETVCSGLDAGKRYTTRALKQMVAAETGAVKPKAPQRIPGGRQALERLAMNVVKASVAEFYERIDRIDAAIRALIIQTKDGRPKVVKAKVLEAVQLDARAARRIYETAFVRFSPQQNFDGARCYSLATAAGDGMLAVRWVVYSLGRAEDWGKGDPALWLVDDVLPILAWALGRGPAPDAVIDRIVDMVSTDAIRRLEWMLPEPEATNASEALAA